MALTMDEEFGLFIQDERGPAWRGTSTDLHDAERKAQEIANTEGVECFVYSFKKFKEIVRCYPAAQNA